MGASDPATAAQLDDRALVVAALGGDRRALGELLERHRPLLLALCRRMLGDNLVAEDAAQEAALQAMLSLARLRDPDRFGPWLAGIGLNVCRRWLRQRGRDPWSWEAMLGGSVVHEPIDLRPGPEAAAEEADLRQWVLKAVDGLPPGQRAAVLLFYLAGLSQAEVAAQLGVHAGAVKTRLHKARASLRRELRVCWEEWTMAADGGAIEVRVADVRQQMRDDGRPAMVVVFLEALDSGRTLPIWVGPAEGIALAYALEKAEVPRPMTFSFMASLLEAAGARLREVVVNRLTGDTYFAEAVVERPAGVTRIDARPSDAINLALETDAPIRVDRAVFDAWEAQKDRVSQVLTSPAGTQTLDAAGIVAVRQAHWEQAHRDWQQR